MTWLPGLIVLAIGLAAGALLARGFQRAKGKKTRPVASGLELRIADLETRRDELYERLREIRRGEGPEEDREPLELAAARALQELERLEGELATKHPKLARERKRAHAAESKPETTKEAAEETAGAAPAPARHFVTGFAYGAGLLLLIAGLIYWAVRDATPRPDQSGPMSTPAATEDIHADTSDLPPAVASRVASITSYLESEPDDLEARKELGYTYLGSSMFVEAYRQAEQILARAPEDPDGLYMQGIVRLTMGQVEIADDLLERALASDPSHVDSLTATGIIRLQMGDYQQAIATWKRGLEAIGGSNAMIERLIRLAEEGRSPEEILSFGGPEPEPEHPKTAEEILGLDPRAAESPPPPPPAPTTPAAAAPAAPAAPATTPAAAGDVITLTLELAPGAAAKPGSVLFVMLRGTAGGPPVAVKRIGAPSFPMTLTLGQEDSMMGAPIPETGTVTARLDVDGSASTRDPGDLEASAEASVGDAVRLLLASGS